MDTGADNYPVMVDRAVNHKKPNFFTESGLTDLVQTALSREHCMVRVLSIGGNRKLFNF